MRDCAQPTKSTGLASSSIPPQSALWAQVKNRTESHRPRATRFKAPSHHRGPGYPACGDTDRRQPKRRHSTSIAGRGYSAHQRQAWQTAIEASGRSGRQRLRPRQIPTSTACRRHCNRNRSTRSASWKRAGQNTLGRGADHFVASQLPPTAHPLRTARFHTRGFPQNRLLHHMLAAAAKVILLTPLSHGTIAVCQRIAAGAQHDQKQDADDYACHRSPPRAVQLRDCAIRLSSASAHEQKIGPTRALKQSLFAGWAIPRNRRDGTCGATLRTGESARRRDQRR